MNIQSINHCGLLVSDLDKSRWFYGTVLGMEEVPRPSTFEFEGAWFRSGNCEIHLLLAKQVAMPLGFPDAGIDGRPAFATHMAFEVPALDAVVTMLEQHDIEIKAGPLARGDGIVQIFVNDFDGYLLEFFSLVEGSEVNAPTRSAIN